MDKFSETMLNAATDMAMKEIESLRQQLAECEKECLEEARLNGMGSEREAKLMAALAKCERERDELVRALEGLSYWSQPRKTDKPELCGFEGKQGDKNFDVAAKALAKLGAGKGEQHD